MRTVAAADANRQFSSILREVKDGHTVVVTSRGKPVARIGPIEDDETEKARKEQAWQELLAHLKTRPILNIPITWTRDDIYDDDFR